MTSYGSRTQALTAEQSDLKKIKQKYSSQLSSLRELFADWSDDDLLFALQEVEGDLYLAIDRISEGHVTQWGEVKSKKSRKEAAQKAKSSTAPVPSPISQTTTPYRNERPPPARGNNDRSRRGGRGGHNSRVQKQSNVQAPAAATWGTSAPTKSFQPSSDIGSWASIASSKMNDSTWGASTDDSESWDAPTCKTTTSNTTTSNDWDTKEPEAVLKRTVSETTTTTTTPATETKTWASLLKSQPKPEPEPVKRDEPEPEQEQEQEQPTTDGTGWDAPSGDGWNAKDPWSSTTDNPTEEPSNDSPSTTAEAADPWTSDELETPKATVIEASPKESEATAAPTPKPTPVVEEQSPKNESSTTTKKITTTRRLKQDAPVVLPNTGASLSSIGVKFGSLSLDDATIETTEMTEITQTTLQSESSVQDEIKQETQPQAERLDGLTSSLQTQPQKQPQPVPQDATPQQSQQTPIQQQQPSNQQQQQQQLFGLDPLASGYNSYLPNQPPAGVSGFGISPMGALPEYNLYGTDVHRAAMHQGYYDPAAYIQSPSTSTYQSRDKHNQDSVGSMPQHTSAQTPGSAQQVYPINMPYYQYYYMPNQFTYQQAAYGQPYMNKNMYPNMYQHSTGKPNAGPATSPYGAAGSPYSQNMYGQSVSGGYDDMSGMQHHLGSMGLQDYQKPYQQLPNFLGAGASTSQQPQQAQQPGTGGAQQSAGKNDKTGGSGSGNATSNGHHLPQKQPQGYQHPAAPGNYFNHSFQYQQQYPQHQQHFQHFQQQAAQQQQSPSGQSSSMGRQQPYWSQ